MNSNLKRVLVIASSLACFFLAHRRTEAQVPTSSIQMTSPFPATTSDNGATIIHQTGEFAFSSNCGKPPGWDDCYPKVNDAHRCIMNCTDDPCSAQCFDTIVPCWSALNYNNFASCGPPLNSSIPQFPPSKGTLTAVRIYWDQDLKRMAGFETASGSTVSIFTLVGGLYLTRLKVGSSPDTSVPFSDTHSDNSRFVIRADVPEYDGIWDYGGTTGRTLIDNDPTISEYYEFPRDGNLQMFVGNGAIYYDHGQYAFVHGVASGFGGVMTGWTSRYHVTSQIRVEYDYIPVPPVMPRLVQ